MPTSPFLAFDDIEACQLGQYTNRLLILGQLAFFDATRLAEEYLAHRAIVDRS